MQVLAIDGSPTGSGRTEVVLRAVLAAAESVGAVATVRSLAELDDAVARVLRDLGDADAVVLGSPVYRASYASPLKVLLDRVPRGMWGEMEAPLRGKAVAVVATGASLHHFLALNDLRNVLAGFFACHVLPPGLYVPRDGFTEDGTLHAPYSQLANQQGLALVELTTALSVSPTLRSLLPQA